MTPPLVLARPRDPRTVRPTEAQAPSPPPPPPPAAAPPAPAEPSTPGAPPSSATRTGDVALGASYQASRLNALVANKPPSDGGIPYQAPPSDAEMKASLEKTASGFQPKYNLPGGKESQPVPSSFRMVGGNNQPTPDESYGRIFKSLGGTKDKPLPPDVHTAAIAVGSGRGTPEQVQLVTQKLIDGGALEKTKAGLPKGTSDEQAIRKMQWDHGVGVDCAGYTQRALYAAHGGKPGDYGLKPVIQEGLLNVKNSKHFTRMDPAQAKPGDMFLLDKPEGRDDVGHAVMIRDRQKLTEADQKAMKLTGDFGGKNVHRIDVTSSWGANGDWSDKDGGVRSRTFLYDADTKKWAEYDPVKKTIEPQKLSEKTQRPTIHGDPIDGIYRPTREIPVDQRVPFGG